MLLGVQDRPCIDEVEREQYPAQVNQWKGLSAGAVPDEESICFDALTRVQV